MMSDYFKNPPSFNHFILYSFRQFLTYNDSCVWEEPYSVKQLLPGVICEMSTLTVYAALEKISKAH